MAVKKVHQIDSAGLRRLAEDQLRENIGTAPPPGTEEEPLRLLHELQVHQIELEMQNAELRQARDERDKMEALLGKYSDLYDFAPVGYFNLDNGGIIRAVNLTGTGFLGVERCMLIGRQLKLFISDETRPVFRDFLDKVFASESKETCEIAFLRKKNSPLVVQVEAVVSESREECRAVVIDITERRRAEEQLRENLKLVQTMVRNAPIVLYGVDRNGVFTLSEGKGLAGMGMKPGEYVGRSVFDVYRGMPECLENFRRALAGEAFMAPVHVGDRIYDAYHEPVFDGDGKYSGTFGVLVDVTEQRRAEEAIRESRAKYRAIVDNFEGLIYICSQDYRVEFMNRKLIERTGYDATGQFCYRMMHDMDSVCPWCVNERVFAGETVHWEMFSPKDNHWYYVVNVPIYHADGTISKQSMILDITKRKQADEEVQQALEAANFVNNTMRRLVRTVAHEFRTPLGLLTGSADILDRYWDRMTPEKRLEQNEHIRNAARQISDLVDSVTSFNRAGTDRAGKPPQLQDIGDLCRSIAAEVENVWCAGHEFIVSLAADCGTALMDDILFRRILQNLLTNAFRYTPTNGTVSLHVCREKEMLVLEITDTGIGIPEEDQALIFDPFFRSRNVEGRRGLGLGLSIVREALSQMGGTVTVTSSLGKGTTMLVKIPVVDPM